MNFVELEKQILEFWKNNNIFQKSVEQRPKNRKFVFYEGPPTANGQPGIHHVLARTFKDIICRYKTMQGFRVERKAGWDTHGLPVELEVQKKLGLSTKKDIIENCGIAEFNKKCKESVWEYKSDWEKLTERIAFWLDMERPYVTYENNYIESVWWIVKQIADKGLLYKDYKVVPYCPKCETVLSSHEVAQGYEKVREEDSIYVKFSVISEEKTYFLVWTTTPWTLPANVVLAIGGEINYVKVKRGEDYLILAKDRLKVLNEGEYQIVETFSGKDLLKKYTKGYQPPFPELYYNGYMHRPGNKGGWSPVEFDPEKEQLSNEFEKKGGWLLWSADFVNTEEGTGIVHIAPAFGIDDFNLAKEKGFPRILETVNEQGNFTEKLGKGKSTEKIVGLFVKDADPLIIEELKNKNILFRKESYEHDYPFCWRCKSPLLYYAKEAWFINMQTVKEKLIKNNQEINWVPAHLKEGRFGEWLKEVKDWALSRERFWATPLPVWQCENKECKQIEVIGSIEELKEKSKKEAPEDLHRPYIDEVVFDCPKCKSTMKRTPEVMDCWFDSGSMPFSQWHYPFENKDLIDKKEQFPAEYISEAIDQTRGWFYTLLAISTLLGFKSPYQNVISLGHILDEKGEKMSKSKGNIVDPWYIVEKYGADSTRWYFFTVNQPWDSKLFTEKDVESTLKRFTMILWNCFVFFETYNTSEKLKAKSEKIESKNILDKWILSRLNNVISEVENNLDKYDINLSARALENFVVNDFSQWYIRRSRKRLQKPETENEKNEALPIFNYVLLNLVKALAPFVPFISEEIFKRLNTDNTESVHLSDWPKIEKKYIDGDLEEKMKLAQELVTIALSERAKLGIKVRQPLSLLKIKNDKLKKDSEIINIIKEEINVKEISFDDKIENAVELDTNITPELQKEGEKRDFIRNVKDLRKGLGLTNNDIVAVSVSTEISFNETDLRKEIGTKIIEIKTPEEMKSGGYFIKELGEKRYLGIKKV